MKKKKMISACIAVFVLVTVAVGMFLLNAGPKPNVILISIDTLRWDHCSAYGYERNTTPTLKKLANQGVSFAAAYSPTSSTCPSHATMFTSLYPITHGILLNDGIRLEPEFETLAERFKMNGYQTAGIISSFVLHSKFGFSQGFDFYDENFMEAHASMSIKVYHEVLVPGGFDQIAGVTSGKVETWLNDQRDEKRPFFLFVHFMDPHDPYVPPQPFASKFGSNNIGQYDGEVAYTDNNIKKILNKIKQLELDKNTLVVIVGDHGEGLGDHNWMKHGRYVYDEAVRVPYIFYWPGHTLKDVVFSMPVDLLTLAPTILDMVGIKYDDSGFDGKSLATAISEGSAPSTNYPVYMQSRHIKPKKSGIRVGDLKYIEHFDGTKKELYNLKNDPKELTNLYSIHQDQADQLRSKIEDWKDAYTRKGPRNNVLSEEDRRKFKSLGYIE